MAIPPKGFDRDEIARLRQIRYEKTNQWRFASDADLSNQSFVTDQFGNRLYDERGQAVRGDRIYDTDTGRFTTRSPRTDFSPNRQDSFVYEAGSGALVAGGPKYLDDDGVDQRPINLTQIPTSSVNAARPRTVAAGYALEMGSRSLPEAQRTGKLTVMFRDGTLWNYYNVPYGVWLTFSNSLSKGPMLNRATKNTSEGVLLSYPHGPADISDIPEEIQEQLWRVSREAQLRYKTTNRARGGYYAPDRRITKKPGQLTQEQVMRRRERARAYVPKSAARKAGYNPHANNGKARKPSNPASRP